MIKTFTFLFMIQILSACVGPEKDLKCASNEAFDQNKRICVKSLGANSETLSITNATPAYDYITSTADSPNNHAITISDKFNNGFVLKWLLKDGNGQTQVLGNDLALEFNQASFPPGTYTLVVKLYDTKGNTALDQHIWNIIITDSDIPTIAQVTTTPIATTEVAPPSIITATISNPSSLVGIDYEWNVNESPIIIKSGSISGSVQNESFTFQTNANYYIGLAEYTISLTLKDSFSDFVYAKTDWKVAIDLSSFGVVSRGSSGLFSSTTPETSSTLMAINEIEISNGGLLFDTNSDGNNEEVDICVQIDNIDGVDGNGVFVDFFSNGLLITSSNFTLVKTPLCLGQLVTSFSFKTGIQKVSAVIYDKYVGASSRPSYRGYTQIEKYEWKVNVRQKNTDPQVSIVESGITCDNKNSSNTYLGCDITIGSSTATDFTLKVTDDDYDADIDFDKFKVSFYLNGALLDGTNNLSDSICVHNYNTTLSTLRYTCSLQINLIGKNGVKSPTDATYSITAVVTDLDSPYSTSTPDEKISNTASWLLYAK